MRTLPLFLLASLAFAGCSGGPGGKGGGPEDGGEGGVGGMPPLHGYVFDPAVTPLEGATVRVLETNASVATDGEGFYGFEGLPTDQFLVLVVTLDGYSTVSQQVTLPQDAHVILNFTLTPIPPAIPRQVPLKKEDLFLACQVGTDVSGQNSTSDCSGGTGQRDRWDFPIDPDLQGAVVEIHWEAVQPGAESLAARLETLELGKLNAVLAEAIGPSPLKMSISQAAAQKYYAAGGLAKLTIWAAPDSDANEAGAGAALAFQQDMAAYVCLFYVQGAPTTFSFETDPCGT